MACARWVTVPGRSPSVLMVPGAPPRTSTPAAAPSGTSSTVHPVWPCVSVQFERGDLMTVVPPFFPLVAEEEVENVLAERLGHQFAVLHHVQRLVQALRQRLDAEDAALAFG